MHDDKTFICGIGAQKAGTSFLADYLYQHPEFMMSPLKELHYFDVKFLPETCSGFETRFINSISRITQGFISNNKVSLERLFALIKRIEASRENDYRIFFNYFVQNKHLAFGEITPSYSMLNKEHFAYIASIYPKHKFIFLLRNPADRFWSQINYDLESTHKNDNPLELIDKCFKKENYILRSNYERTIKELLSVVDKSNVCIEFYENIFSKKSEETIAKISEFIGINFYPELLNSKKKVNTTSYKASLTENYRLKIINNLQNTYKYIIEEYDAPESWKNDYETIRNK
ncbi:MAG: sulfotransferase [Campylobacterota bacterium]|nr:sulfotransferase [Campylobacterota bacterium]